MSEIHEPDLDRAFAALTSDLTTCSNGPGARAAVATARKRRRTRMGAVAVIAAVVVAGFAAPSLIGGTRDDSLVGSGTLPTPAPLTPSSLSAATRGWTGPWEKLDKSNEASLKGIDSACLDGVAGAKSAPQRINDQAFVSPGGIAAVAIFIDFGKGSEGASEYATSFTQALNACGARFSEAAYEGAALTHASVANDAGRGMSELWFAQLDHRVAMLAILGPESPASADTTGAVTETFLGALQDESSYDGPANAPIPTAEISPSSFADLTLAQIHEATGSWSKDWKNGSSSGPATLPCLSNGWPESASWMQGTGIGDRGVLTFAGTDQAGREVNDIMMTLAQCGSTKWVIHAGTDALPSGTAWASYDGGSAFFAERDGAVASLRVRGLGVPSDEVARQVTGILKESLANPTSLSEAPDPSEGSSPSASP